VQKLTCAYLKTVGPKPGRPTRIIRDGTVGGLSARIGARGAAEFSLVYRFKDEVGQQRRTLGYFWDADRGPPPSGRYLTLEQARILALTLKEKARAGDPELGYQWTAAAPPTAPAPNPADAVEAILDRYAREHLSTLRTGPAFEKLLRRSCAAFLQQPITSVTRADVRAILDGHMREGHGAMANRTFAVLGAFFKWCVDKDLLVASPMATMGRPVKKEASRDRVLTDAELAAVWHAVGTLTPARRDAIRLLALTGLRRGEASELKWSDISGDMLTIPGERTKNNRLTRSRSRPRLLT